MEIGGGFVATGGLTMYAWGFIIMSCILLFTSSLADNWQWGGRAFKWQFMV